MESLIQNYHYHCAINCLLHSIQHNLAHLLVFMSKRSISRSFFIEWTRKFSESARNLVQQADLNCSWALFPRLWHFPFAISLNNNWLSACSHSPQGSYFSEAFKWHLRVCFCRLVPIQAYSADYHAPLVTVSHFEPTPRCADVFLTRKKKKIYRMKRLCATEHFTSLAL